MEAILDQLFVTFPFEKKIFNPDKLPVEYVGHPIVEEVSKSSVPPLEISSIHRVLAIFPGSRKKEILRNFPQQIRVAKRLLDEHPELFLVISVSEPKFSLLLDDILKSEGILDKTRIMFTSQGQNHALMKRASLAIAKSGTNNLELALYGVPTIVTYAISPLDYFIAKHILRIRLPHFCIVNILANERIYPELYGPQFTEQALYFHAKQFLTSEKTLQECREKCLGIGKILETKQPEQEISLALKSFLDNEKSTSTIH